MGLIDDIKNMQRMVGAKPDGIVGPETIGLVLQDLARVGLMNPSYLPKSDMDERSTKNLLTLDAKAMLQFETFYRLANATAATLGCSYIITSGNRTWDEQDALYAQSRTAPGPRVTNAKGGQSNHNFGIAADFSVFQGKIWLEADDKDGGNSTRRTLAAKVHKACSMHAEACGLEWGGSWKSIVDQPHYEIATGLTMMRKRELYQEKGSVL